MFCLPPPTCNNCMTSFIVPGPPGRFECNPISVGVMHCRAKVPAAYPCACAMEDVPRAISGASVTRLWWLPAHRGEGVAARGTRSSDRGARCRALLQDDADRASQGAHEDRRSVRYCFRFCCLSGPISWPSPVRGCRRATSAVRGLPFVRACPRCGGALSPREEISPCPAKGSRAAQASYPARTQFYRLFAPLKLRLLHLRSGWRRRCPLFSVWPAHYGFEWLATRPITEPSRIVLGRKDRWHSIMDLGHQIVPVGGDNRECPDPLTGCRVLPVFP